MATGFVYVMLGGACGAALRYLLMVGATQFESKALWGILGANLIGCFLAGLLFGAQFSSDGRGVSDHTYYFLAIGLLGSLTTLSSFSVETLSLFGLPDRFVWTEVSAWAYFFTTTIGGLLACVAGIKVV